MSSPSVSSVCVSAGSPLELAVLVWNVRGANNPAKRRALQLFFSDKLCNIVCLQEVKIEVLSRSLVIEMLGSCFGDNYVYLPAIGFRGGILIAYTCDFQITVDPLTVASRFSITGSVVNRTDNTTWAITAVYGPQEDAQKVEFMQEIRLIKTLVQERWMILGDFNLICSAAEKNNANLNLRQLGQFRALIQDLELIDYPLVGRKFTWSNERAESTQTRIDRVLVSKEWDLEHPQLQLTTASTNVSDHCPLMLSKMDRKHYAGFRFEAHWLLHDEFLPVAKKAWSKHVRSRDAIRVLHTKLCRTAKALKNWNRGLVRWDKFVSQVADEVIFNLDVA